MVLVFYVDDILVFAKEPKVTMDELRVREPNIYLAGADMEKVQLPNGQWAARGVTRKTLLKWSRL